MPPTGEHWCRFRRTHLRIEKAEDVGNGLRSREKESLYGIAAEPAKNLEVVYFLHALCHGVKPKVGR